MLAAKEGHSKTPCAVYDFKAQDIFSKHNLFQRSLVAQEQKIATFSCINVLFDALPARPKCSQYVKVVRSEP